MDTAITAAKIQPGPQTSNRSALWIVFIVVFIDLLGFAIVLPLLPVIGDMYVEPLAPSGANHGLYVGITLGLLMASFSLMQFLFAPLWGRLSDRIGRRPILLLGLAGSVAGYALLGYACQLPADLPVLAVVLLFASRIGAGIAGASIGTAQAVIADSTPPDKRKHGMAVIGAAFGIGFTFGPLFGYAALHWFPDHLEAVGYSAAGLSALALIVASILLPETRIFSSEPLARRSWNVTALISAISNGSIGPIVLVFFLSTVGFASFETTMALFLNDIPFLGDKKDNPVGETDFQVKPASFDLRRGARQKVDVKNGKLESIAFDKNAGITIELANDKSSFEVAASMDVEDGEFEIIVNGTDHEGRKAAQTVTVMAGTIKPKTTTLLFFAYVGFTLLLTQGFIYRRLARRLSEVAFMTMGILFMFTGVSLLSFVCYCSFPMDPATNVPLLPLLFAALTAAVMGFAFMTPSAQALISRRTSADMQGEVLGINQSAAAMARIVGPLVGIPLYKATDAHMLPYLFGAGLLVLMLPFMPRIRRG